MNFFSYISNVISSTVKGFTKKSPTITKSEKSIIETVITHDSNESDFAIHQPISTKKTQLPLEKLKLLATLRGFDEQALSKIDCTVMQYPKDAIIFKQGQKVQNTFYLLTGTVLIKPNGGNPYIVSDDIPLANLPLNSGHSCGATAVASQNVSILAISGAVNSRWENNESMIQRIEAQISQNFPQNHFLNHFLNAYDEGSLQLPTLPHIALKLKEAMTKDISIDDAVHIISVDLAISSKLIQVANSPLYAPIFPIHNIHDAVTRLGLEATRKLVMGVSLQHLFQCRDPRLMTVMRNLWKTSLYVSSLSFVLAQECSVLNPEDALLAGLISDIGITPLLHFAEQHNEKYDLNELLSVIIPQVSPMLGALMLPNLGFSSEFNDVPLHAHDWFYESGNDVLTLADGVILARLHSYLGSGKTTGLPYINSIPAYAKLKNGKLNPDFSLDILVQAQQRIDTARSMFG